MKKVLSLVLCVIMAVTLMAGFGSKSFAASGVAAVTADKLSGSYTTAQTVALKCATSGAQIYYTLDGKTPTSKSAKYAKPIVVDKNTTIKAVAIKAGSAGPTATFTYAIRVASVKASAASGKYTSAQKVTLSCPTAGAAIYYTTNGSTPTDKSTKYTGAITIDKTTILKAVAIKSGMMNSSVAVFSYSVSKAKLSGKITMSGASALYPLAKYVADLMMAQNPDLSIIVNAGGSGVGLNNVRDKVVDIGNSDVYAQEKLKAEDAAKLVDHKVCVIGVGIVVHPDVGAKVTNLTKDQLKKIFSGAITNWKEVGGPDQAIVVINRPSSSGTRALFVKYGLDGQKDIDGDTSLQTDDSNALLTTVSKTKGAIGYLALSYTKSTTANVKLVSLDGVAPTYENIYSNKYQIWGYEHMYTHGEPAGAVKAFLDFAMSPDLAAQYEALGYGSSSKLSSAAANSR